MFVEFLSKLKSGIPFLGSGTSTDYRGYDPYDAQPTLSPLSAMHYQHTERDIFTKNEKFEHDTLVTLRGILHA